MAKAILKGITIFQSTLPVWRATRASPSHRWPLRPISIHAPRMGNDHVPVIRPVGRSISIHAPRMGSDSKNGEVYDLFL